MFKNKTFLKIFSLLAAICLWVYVIGEVDPETRDKVGGIPVHFTNTDLLAEEGLAVLQEEEIIISAIVKGKRSEVNGVKKSGLTAYVDVSDCEEGANTKKIELSIPDGISLESISEETLEFTVEELVEEEKPVEIEFYGNGNSGGNDWTPWIIEMEPETVTVRGAKSSVKKVSALRGDISMEQVSEARNRWVTEELTPVTKRDKVVSGLILEQDEVEVNVQLMAVKTVKLEVTTENLEDDVTISEMEVPEEVVLVGPASVLDGMAQINGTVDLKGVTNTGKLEVELELPENVYLYEEENPPIAEITMKADE